MIKINNVDKFYNKNKTNQIQSLKDINIELPDKGIIAIFGPSGCGKTTLLNVIGGLDNVNKGNIFIDGQNIKYNTDKEMFEDLSKIKKQKEKLETDIKQIGKLDLCIGDYSTCYIQKIYINGVVGCLVYDRERGKENSYIGELNLINQEYSKLYQILNRYELISYCGNDK